MLNKYIIVKKEVFKTGTTNGKKWTIWRVQDSEGNKHSSFEDLQLDTELELEQTDETYKKKDGTEGKGSRLSYPKKPKGIDPSVIGEIKDMIAAINQRLDFFEIRMNRFDREKTEADKPQPPF